MKLLITVIGLVLVLEGLPYAAFPEAAQSWLRQLSAVEPKVLRTLGLIALIFGLFLCYLTQRTDLFS